MHPKREIIPNPFPKPSAGNNGRPFHGEPILSIIPLPISIGKLCVIGPYPANKVYRGNNVFLLLPEKVVKLHTLHIPPLL